jgi:hypothetical protein
LTYTQYSFELNMKEDMTYVLGHGYLPSNNLRPSERHQIFEDTLRFQKELANEIYIQRCKEKDL